MDIGDTGNKEHSKTPEGKKGITAKAQCGVHLNSTNKYLLADTLWCPSY